MKNSTKWCNIYLSASKYNILVSESKYQQVFYGVMTIVVGLSSLALLSNYYLLAMFFSVLAIVALCAFLSLTDNIKAQRDNLGLREHLADSTLIVLTQQGEVTLNQGNDSYQLLASSRYSFIGCWLVLLPNKYNATSSLFSNRLNVWNYFSLLFKHRLGLPSKTNSKAKVKQLFIFKDSISRQDFSRLSNVINQLL